MDFYTIKIDISDFNNIIKVIHYSDVLREENFLENDITKFI